MRVASAAQVDSSHQTTNFRRRIYEASIQAVPGCGVGPASLLELRLRGTAFLWHQAHCSLGLKMQLLFRAFYCAEGIHW